MRPMPPQSASFAPARGGSEFLAKELVQDVDSLEPSSPKERGAEQRSAQSAQLGPMLLQHRRRISKGFALSEFRWRFRLPAALRKHGGSSPHHRGRVIPNQLDQDSRRAIFDSIVTIPGRQLCKLQGGENGATIASYRLCNPNPDPDLVMEEHAQARAAGNLCSRPISSNIDHTFNAQTSLRILSIVRYLASNSSVSKKMPFCPLEKVIRLNRDIR